MKRVQPIVIFLIMIFIGVASAYDFPLPDEIEASPLNFNPLEPAEFQLQNGINVWMFKNKTLPLVNILIEINAGEFYENHNTTGISSLVASMLTSGGTASMSPMEVDEFLECNAIDMRSFSMMDMTRVEMSCLAPDIDKALAMMKEIVFEPAFDEERLTIVKENEIARLKRYRDNPFFEARYVFEQAIFGENNPIAQIPSDEQIRAFTREQLVEYHQKFFRPDRVKIAAVGDFKMENMEQLMLRHFNVAAVDDELKLIDPVPEPKYTKNTVVIVDKEATQASLFMGHLGPPPSNPDHYALEIFNLVFGASGFSSRLMNRVRTQEGLAYFVFGAFQKMKPRTVMNVGLQTKTDSAAEAVKLCLEIMNDMRTENISSIEMKMAKESTVNSFVFKFERPMNLIKQIFYYKNLSFDENYLEKYLANIRKVTREDVLNAAKTHIDPMKLVMVAVGPKDILTTEFESLGWDIVYSDKP